ncbi:MAG TPA: zinc-binding dehydrogenase [Actinomycetes bacterium]|nr:zinc-binding dehydrogenase [Actinomycetes bacterium]
MKEHHARNRSILPACPGERALPATRGSWPDRSELRRMKPKLILVNTARGPIVNDAALHLALNEGWIPGPDQVTVRNLASGVCYSQIVPMSPSDPTDIACLIGCAVLTGAGAVLHTAKVEAGQSVAVFGAGGVGLSAIGVAAIAGANPIIAVDLLDRKLQFATEFGASYGVSASNTDAVAAIRAISPGGVDYALDAVGVPTTALQILEAVKQGGPRADNQGGMAVLLGIPVADVSVDLNAILLYQCHYCGSLGATEPDADFRLFLEWARTDKFPLGKLVTNRYSLEHIDEARVALEEGQILGRAIIEI